MVHTKCKFVNINIQLKVGVYLSNVAVGIRCVYLNFCRGALRKNELFNKFESLTYCF